MTVCLTQKTLIWGHFGPFLPKFVQKSIFLKKRALSVIKYSNYLPTCQKSEKTNDRQTDRQTDNGNFIGPSVRRGSN